MKTIQTKQSTICPEITINFYTGSGWHLSKGQKVDSPLALISNPILRQKVIAEADDIVWPIKANKEGLKKLVVKVFTDSGRAWSTEIGFQKVTRLEVANYFLGQSFEYDENKPCDIVTKIEF